MTHARRVNPLPGNPFDRGEKVQFQFEGRPLEGYDHEPLAVALAAAGVRVFSRSIKYHRPRGPVCLHGHCSACLMRVNGIPNVRTCETTCRSGMVVERQIGWPSTGLDLFRAVDLFSGERLDHQGMFTASSTLNRLASGLVRKLSGLGDPPSADPKEPLPVSRFESEVVVVGGGAAGLAAARALGECGHGVVLLESEPRRGGRLLDGATRLSDRTGAGETSGWEWLRSCKAELESIPGIEVHVRTPALAVYPGDGLAVLAGNPDETFLISARRLVICTGAYEQVPLFSNNDLPGIFGPRAMDRLACGFGVVPSEPVLVVGQRDHTLRLAGILSDLGVALAAVVTSCRQGEALQSLKEKKVNIVHDHRIVQALGGRWLDRVELAPQGSQQPDLVLDCRACVVEAPEGPAYELPHHAGCRVSFHSDSGYVVSVNPEGQTTHSQVFAAGHVAGASSVEEAVRSGERAGLACALSLKEDPKVRARLRAGSGE